METFTSSSTMPQRCFGILLSLAFIALVGVLPYAATPTASQQQTPLNRLTELQKQGQLTLGLLKTTASYQERQHDAVGFDYEAAQALAEDLGLSLQVRPYDTPTALRQALESGEVDLISSELSAHTLHSDAVPYYTFDLVAVLPRQTQAPSAEDLTLLKGIKSTFDQTLPSTLNPLTVTLLPSAAPEDVLHAVAQGHYDYALMSQQHFQRLSPFFPELKVGPTLQHQPIAWHVAQHNRFDNDALVSYLTHFAQQQQQHLAQLAEHHFTPTERFNLYASRAFKEHWQQRLQHYSDDFQRAGQKHGFDWLLLAAVGYQESHWDPNAVSPTGVKGLMMLTQPTAREMGVTDRSDPTASIDGGAAYLAGIHHRMPETINEPDRTWMALAAYNAGYGHLLDARRLTAEQGDNPDNWAQVAKRLPLLTQPEYYQHARYGYARGGAQAVYYVEAVQHYYQALLWAEQHWGNNAHLMAMAP